MRALRRGATALVVVVGCGVGGFAVTDYVRHHRHDADTVGGTPVPHALDLATAAPAAVPARPAPLPTATGVASALRGVVTADALGTRLRAIVVDAASGTVLYDRGADALTTPASTAKLLTATAVLAVRNPTDRLSTSVVRGATAGTVVLVGGGDPTLTAASGRTAPDYPGAARIADLAAQLRKRNIPINRIVVDGSLFSGPRVSPGWAPDDVPSDYASAITAVMTDGGRAFPGDLVRSETPDLAAGEALAAALDIPNADVVVGRAPAHAARLARVESAPIGRLVEQMLLSSDNVIAECLARQVAIAKHLPASFAGAAVAVRQVLRGLGVDPGAGLLDGSGLSAGDRVSVRVLAGVIRLVVGRPSSVLAALPVSAWSGTLVHRYRGTGAAGVVRAKTGTLTDVSALAGVVHDRDGRLLVFALVADQVTGDLTPYADTALDAIVAALAGCGCR